MNPKLKEYLDAYLKSWEEYYFQERLETEARIKKDAADVSMKNNGKEAEFFLRQLGPGEDCEKSTIPYPGSAVIYRGMVFTPVFGGGIRHFKLEDRE
jgi:hypothetical protein